MSAFRAAAIVICAGAFLIGLWQTSLWLGPQTGHGTEVTAAMAPVSADANGVVRLESFPVAERPLSPDPARPDLTPQVVMLICAAHLLPAFLWLAPVLARQRWRFAWTFGGAMLLMPVGGIIFYTLGMTWIVTFMLALIVSALTAVSLGVHRLLQVRAAG